MKHEIRMFPDSLPLLKELKNKYKLVIITSSTRKFLELKIKVDGIENFFSKIFSTPDDFKKRTKDPEVYSEVLRSLKLKPEELIHIGDSYEADYLSPRKVGITAFFLDRSKERKGEEIVHSLSEFKEKIKCLN